MNGWCSPIVGAQSHKSVLATQLCLDMHEEFPQEIIAPRILTYRWRISVREARILRDEVDEGFQRGNSMAHDAHKKAAEHHEHAAKAHHAAAAHHAKGDHAAAHEQATKAHEHSETAQAHSTEAHQKSSAHHS